MNKKLYIISFMPVLGGWGFLEELAQADDLTGKKITIYMVSSSTDEGDVKKSRQYNMVQGYHHKPLNTENLGVMLGG